MALYEYQCVKCDKKSEFIQNFSDPHKTKCPLCGGALKKLLSSPAVQFKGSGFYATDYGKSGGSRNEDSKGEKGEEKKISSKGERDSSKGKKESGGETGAAPSSPTGPSTPAPSKKKKGDTR